VGASKGVPNKLTTGAKEVIAQVAANIGGVARMTEWVRKSPENEKAFWTNIYTKLLPLQVAGDKDNPLSVIHRIERTIVEHQALSDDTALSASTINNEVTTEHSAAELPKPKRHWSDDC
jgi:hypothetical protein